MEGVKAWKRIDIKFGLFPKGTKVKEYSIFDRENIKFIDVGRTHNIAKNICHALNENEKMIRSLESILRQANVTISLIKPEGVKVWK